MTQKSETGLRLCPPQRRDAPAAALILPAAAMALTGAGLFALLGEGLGFASVGGYAASCAAGLVLGLFALFLMAGRGWRTVVFAALAAAILLSSAIFYPRVRAGAAALMNAGVDAVGRLRGEIFLDYDGASAGCAWCAVPGSAVICILLAAAALYAPWLGGVLLCCTWIPAAAGALPAGPWLGIYSLGCLLMLLCFGMSRRAGRPVRAIWQSAAAVTAALAILASAVLIPGLRADNTALKTASERRIHALRYERAAQPLPEGDFADPAPLADPAAPMAEVTMSRPESMYLRTFTGDRFTDRGWERTEPEERWQSRGLFYWLHKNGFYPETQLALLADALGAERETVDVAVRSLGACRAEAMVPNELEPGAAVLHESGIGASVRSPGLTGAGDYAYAASTDLTGRAYELLKALEEGMDGAADYLSLEESYRRYVYETELNIPAEAEEIIALGLRAPEERLTTYEAKYLVRRLLEKNAVFDGSIRPGAGAEGLASFLSGGGGDSAAYASAATLLLRRCGVPARYCEGYLITPGDVAGLEGETKITLTAASAHAWAEYYEDGVGWIPFESAPPYIGLMSESGWEWFVPDTESVFEGRGLDGEIAGGWEYLAPPEEEPEELPEEQEEPEGTGGEGSESAVDVRALVTGILLGLLALLVLAILYILIRHARKKKALESAFADASVPDAVGAIFANGARLMWASGFDSTAAPLARRGTDAAAWFGGEWGYDEAARLNDEALFSTHPLAEEDRQSLLRWRERALAKARERLSPAKRAYEKWIRCLY